MADNLDVTPGTGATVAADEIAGVKWQRVKVGVGADGSATDLAPGQTNMAGSIPVVLPTDQSAIPVTSPNISVAAAISGQKTVTTSGTAVQGDNVPLTNGVYIQGLHGNTGIAYIWWAAGNGKGGYELSTNQQVIVQVSNLNQLWFDATVSGEGISWLKG